MQKSPFATTSVLLCVVSLLGCAAGESGGGSSAGSGGGSPAGAGGRAAGTGGTPASATGGSSGTGTGGGEQPGSGGSSGSGGAGGSGPADGGGSGGETTPGPVGPPPGSLADFKHSKILKLDTTAAGAGVMGNVTNYPVAVVLDATNFDFAQARDKGEDLRFSKMDGSPLGHAIEDWDRAGQAAMVWVKLPEVLGNNNTQSFRMHWGHAGAPDTSDSQAVFAASEGYLGVYHLNEDGSEIPNGYKDASGSGIHGTGVKMAPGSRVDARLGKGTLLTNSRMNWKGQWIKVDDPKVLDGWNASAQRPISVSIWARANSFPGHSTIGGYETIFSKGDTSWTLQKFSFNSSWESCTKAPGAGHYCAISRINRTATNQWFHFMIVVTSGGIVQYINGVQDGRTGNGGRVSNHPFGIGQQTQSLMGKREWDGILDEARVMAVARDANWAKLEFESQKEGQKFLTFGATETRP